jgi:hypothetical protein
MLSHDPGNISPDLKSLFRIQNKYCASASLSGGSLKKRELNKKDLKKNEKSIFHVDFTSFWDFTFDNEYRYL